MGTRDVVFRLRYERRQLVAKEQIPEGAALTPDNTRIETIESDRPEPAGWAPPYGQVVTCTVPANGEIRPDVLIPARSTVVVRRNETVQIRLERPCLLSSFALLATSCDVVNAVAILAFFVSRCILTHGGASCQRFNKTLEVFRNLKGFSIAVTVS